ACELFTRIIVTHVSIRSCDTSSMLYNTPSQAYTTLPYHLKTNSNPQLRLLVCAPLHLPRGPTRLVSYYAFFKGWLLLCQPPSCLCLPTSFPTYLGIWGLSWRSGLFPSPQWTLAPTVCLPDITHRYSEFASVW